MATARILFLNIQGWEMVSGETLDPVGATLTVRGLCATGCGNRPRNVCDGEAGQGAMERARVGATRQGGDAA
ncbi:hypothetical protein C7402_1513 [Paraburkholderia unamae]|uniref:Uncharacterized protein n=3 Tax=Paraburkholderia unamae TaxID=219649 RepID=A0ABX5K5S3_9BURK|nr:hypothetical protein C7402_1513 [Paraburkholderia unamae]